MRSNTLATIMVAIGLVSPAKANIPNVPTVQPSKSKLCQKAHALRQILNKKHGHKAPGRNICRKGLKNGNPPSTHAKAVYVRALKSLRKRAPMYLRVKASYPRKWPAGTMTRKLAPTGLASCIVHSESRGNRLASNGQYLGIAQWSPEAWGRHGGRKYASTPHGASYQEQLMVLSNGLRRYGCRDWCPFDGC